jgi:hypothetical protein
MSRGYPDSQLSFIENVSAALLAEHDAQILLTTQ